MTTNYICSACGGKVSSEGTEALDHMVSEHGVDPEAGPQADSPYLIPEESNPTLDEDGVPT
jgi:hypothetical protein